MENRNTKNVFITAFWKLYNVKPIEKISINELCHSAGYNRATFYNHFENIYDLLDQAIDGIFISIKEKVLSISDFRVLLQDNTLETLLLTCFLKKNEYIELLFKRNNFYLLNEKMKRELLPHIKNQLKDDTANFYMVEVLLEYQISGVLGVIGNWYQHNKPISEQDLVKRIYNISSNGVLNSLKYELDKRYEK